PDLPAVIRQQAENNDFGAFMGLYKPWLPSVPAVVGAAIGVNALYGVILLLIRALANIVFSDWFVIPILFIILGIYIALTCDLKIYLFSHGLIRTRKAKVDLVHWGQITSIVEKSQRSSFSFSRKTQGFVIKSNTGVTLKFDSTLKHMNHLGENIRRGILLHRLPSVIEAYNRGSMLPFGPLTVSKQGLSNSRELLMWDEIRNIEFRPTKDGGVVVITDVVEPSPWVELNASQIPNTHVFLELVKYARTGLISY
ncbi:MAG TPA: DUF6585 family protein, partial [Ktedonobacteraceae bacterium]|nr:DUF6585 family protein [Ktedonobacteraceae bacterium]